MKLAVVIAAALALAAPATALAQVSTITDKGRVGADGRKSIDKDGRICKVLVITGSRLPTKKVCKTQEEWDRQREMSKDELDELSRRNGSNNRIEGAAGG